MSFIPRNLFRPLLQALPKKGIMQVRWQHVETAQVEPKVKKKRYFYRWLGALLSTLTVVGLYECRKQLQEYLDLLRFARANELDAYSNFKQMENLLMEIKNFRMLLGDKSVDAKLKEFIRKTEKAHEGKITELKQQYEQILKEKEKKAAIAKEEEIANLQAQHQIQIKKLNSKLLKHSTDGKAEKAKLDLYERCPRDHETKCVTDLHKVLGTTSFLKFNRGHRFSPSFVPIFGPAIQLNTSIQSLVLYGTYIIESGFLELMEALKNNPNIKTLDLGYTNIGLGDTKWDVEALCAMLRVNRTLQELNLQDNYLQDADVDLLEEALRNQTLKKLNLANTNVSRSKKQKLAKVLGMEVA